MLDMIKAQMGSAVPFAKHAGIELKELSPTVGIARLLQRHEVSNHVGTMHAGALFSLAETASGAVMAGIFAQNIMNIRPVVSEARITYLKSARGDITATATTALTAEALQAQLDEAGHVVFDVMVNLTDENAVNVAKFSATWNVKKT
jgi:uncharacterized protein (TIGR00369 family)